MRVLNAAQMREADRRTIQDIGIPSLVLMENAGRQAVAAMEAAFTDLTDRQVAVLCRLVERCRLLACLKTWDRRSQQDRETDADEYCRYSHNPE